MHRNYASAGLLTQPLHARQVPDFGIATRGGATLKAKDAPSLVQLQTKFAGKIGEVVALHFIGTSPVALRTEGCAGASVEALEVTEGGARRAPLPQVRNVSIRRRLSQLEQSGSDGGVPEVMIRARTLHTQGILKILNWWVR